MVRYANRYREMLDRYGFKNTELIISGDIGSAAFLAEFLMYMQSSGGSREYREMLEIENPLTKPMIVMMAIAHVVPARASHPP